MSDSSWPHGLQHARLPCPSSFTRVCSNSCLLSRWCCLTISSSLTSFSSCLQSFPALVSFPNELALGIRWAKYWSFSFIFIPVNIQGWFSLGSIGLTSLLSKGLSKSSLALQFESINSLVLSHLYGSTLISVHDYWRRNLIRGAQAALNLKTYSPALSSTT